MLAAKRYAELGLRDVITAVAAPLRPGAVVGRPVLRTILREGGVPLRAAALLSPALLLLPRSRLLLRALGLRLLPGLLGLLDCWVRSGGGAGRLGSLSNFSL